MGNRITDWLSEENLERAAGKTREEIFEEFGNELAPIAYIPAKHLSLLGDNVKDPRIYCGKGYFIDHALRNHGGQGTQIDIDDVDVGKYLNIQYVLDNPDHIKETFTDGKRTVVFIKKIGRYFAELTQLEENGRIVLHKSMFNQKKEPYAKLPDIRQKDTSSEGGASSISHADNAAPAISLESRGDAVSSEPRGTGTSEGKVNDNTPAVQGNSEKSSEKEGEKALSEKIREASADVNTEPTEAQKEAGNYKKGHVRVGTFDITIEQPEGSVRRGTDADGRKWESKMHNTYGYFKGTEGVDGDHIDVFLSTDIDGWNGRKVYVVDQYNPDGSFDEHKVMLGFNDADEAKGDYLANYKNGWENGRRIDVSAVNLEDFEKWIESSHRKTKPFSEYAWVKMVTEAGKADGATESDGANRSDKADKGATGKTDKADVIPANPEVQGHDWSQYKKGDVFDYDGYKSRYLFTEKENGGRVTGVIVEHLDDNGNAVGRESVPPLMFVEHYKKVGDAEQPKTVREHKADGVKALSGRECVLRDAIVGRMRESGIEVIDDVEAGQRVLDAVNEDVKLEAKRKRALETVSVSRDEEHQQTVISSADGAKVLNNLDTLVKDYKNSSHTKEKTFIGTVAKALGAERDGSKSEYATFETKNGKIVTIRLADHNAKVSAFDNHGELNGISIVVSPKANEGTTNDGNAHVTEFFYDAIKLRRAGGKPLAEIVKSIKQALYSGEFKDTTGLAERQEVNTDKVREHRVYHGSGADFDAFDHSHMGEGEGAQAYGWGTYVTEVEGIGRTYAEAAHTKMYGLRKEELSSNIYRAKERLPFMREGDAKAEMERQIAEWEDEYSNLFGTRVLYTVDIPDDNGSNYLDWEKLSDNDVKKIGKLLDRKSVKLGGEKASSYLAKYKEHMSGQGVYNILGDVFGRGGRPASEALSSIGYTGIKYPANSLRGGRSDGAENYVIFNEANAKIVDKVRYFRTANGEAYGFTVGGKIYIDPRIAGSDTPIHEYAHLWATALKAGNPGEWKNVVSLMKGTSVWNEVKKLYPDLKTDDEIADEVLAHYSGRRGAERLREEARKIADGNGSVFEKAEAISALERVKRALDAFWKGVCDFLHIHYTSAEEVADRVMKDLLDGVDVRKFGKTDGKLMKQEDAEMKEIVAKAKAEGTYMKAPNGARSKLSPRQWAQVRTSAFKEWFGDWEKATKWKAINEMNATPIENRTVSEEDAHKAYDNIGVVENAIDGKNVDFVKSSFGKIVRHKGVDTKMIMDKLDVLFREALPLFFEKEVAKDGHKDHSSNFVGYHHYLNKIEIDGKEYYVRFTAQEIRTNPAKKKADGFTPYQFHNTSISDVDIYESTESSVESPGTFPATGTDRAHLDAKLANFLKEAKESYENSSKAVDENGEPRVVYHQTNSTVWINRETGENYEDLDWKEKDYWDNEATQEEFEDTWEEQEFYTFDNKNHGRRSVEMPAFFFAPEYDEYHEYGDRTIEAFLNIKNPAINPDIEDRGVYDDAGEKAMQKLIDAGYDGFIRKYDGKIEEINAFYPNQIKSATDNVGTFDAENNDIRYQFVGEKGASAADHAEEVTTRLDNLAVAREMEEAKKDAKAIKMATGWERGADGKWRYEIPDIEYVEKGDADLERTIARQPWSKEYDALWERVFAGETLPEADMKRLDELSSKAQEVTDVYNSRDEKILADYVHADELFKSYPELKRVKVVFVNKDASVGGSYSDETNTIYINEKSPLPYDEVFAHEVQHAVQHIEGFAEGGSQTSVSKKSFVDMLEADYEKACEHLDEVCEKNGISRFDALDEDFDANGNEELKQAISKFNATRKKLLDNPYERYQSLAGEVESRNVQKRLGMTPEERRASLASETEDVAREDQIFLYGEGGESHMGSRVDKRMAEIGKHYEGKDLTDAERAVVDVFSGKRDRRSVDITNDKGISIHLELQQGNESHAGTKHSIFRHVGKDNGSISYDEIRLIPDIVKTGERTDKGKNVVYQKKIDGVRYTVYTDKKSKKEIFHDFYSNRKTAESESLSGESTNTQSSARTSDNAVDRKASDSGVSYTQLSAHANLSDAFDAAKIGRKPETANKNAAKDADAGLKFRLFEDEDPKGAATPAEGGRARDQAGTGTTGTETDDTETDAQGATGTTETETDGENENGLGSMGTRGSMGGVPTGATEAKRMEAERLAGKFNTRLNIIEDTNAIVHDNPTVQARRRKAKGWYDTRTGEVTIVLPNNMNVEDVAETVFHETVGHKGLRELIGEKSYSDFLREVYEHAKADVRRRIAKIAAKRNWDFEKATDEYLAGLAEKGFEDFDREERSMWQWLKEKVMAAIDKFLKTLKLPKNVKLGDNELRYMLWRSKERLERGKEDIVDMARDIAKREELGLSETTRYKMGDAPETFRTRQERAVENKGTVMPSLNDAKVKETDVPRHLYKGHDVITQACNAAIDRYSEKVDGKKDRKLKLQHYDNNGTEFDYVISPKSVKEAANHVGNSDNIGVHIAVMDNLHEVINNSIEVEEHPDVLKKDGIHKFENGFNQDVLMHRFVGAVRIAGEVYRVKTTMKEYKNPEIANGHYTYEVTKIEVLSETPSTSNGRSNVSDVFVSGAKLLQNVGKAYDAGKNLLAESKKVDAGILFRDAKSRAAFAARQWRRAHDVAKDWLEKLHIGDITTVYDSIDDVPGSAAFSARRRMSKGWYDQKAGKIVIVLSNHRSPEDVLRTILHESVAHYGLRKMFGAHFDDFLDNVYYASERGIRAKIDEKMQNLKNKSEGSERTGEGWRRLATEEYLAGLAEDTDFERAENNPFEANWFHKVMDYFLQMLKRMGLKGVGMELKGLLSDNELRYILWRSYQNMANPGRYRNVFQAAEDIAMQHRLGVGNYAKEAVRNEGFAAEKREDAVAPAEGGRAQNRTSEGSAETAGAQNTTATGDGSTETAEPVGSMGIRGSIGGATDEGIMYRDGDSVEYEKAMARDTYERRVSRGMYQTQEALQDSMLGLKEAMDAILKAEGNGKTHIEDVAGYENAYLGENRLSSVNQAECSEFAKRLFKPLLAEVAELAGTADERAELTDYMMARHGLERNEVMARRSAQKDADKEYGAEIRKAERAVANDPSDQDALDALAAARQHRDELEGKLYMKNRSRDYSGLTALTETDNVADAEDEAKRMVADYEQRHGTILLWARVNNVTKATLRKTYESGLINKAVYDDISSMYAYYIPLRGFDEETSAEAYAYLADRHSAFNSPIKTAKGRKSKADDPFANMEAMAESAIMQGNRNTLVKQKFLNFALNHPSDLVSVSDLWLRYDDVKGEWEPMNTGDIAGTEPIEDDDSAADVERKMRDFEAAMEKAAKSDPAHFQKQKDNPEIPYRVVESRDLRQHQVLVKRNGKDVIMTVNGNPRAAQALNGQTNPDNDVSGAIGAVMHLGEYVNRQLSAFYTTRNPDFVVSNFVRDLLYSNSMVWVKESPNYAWRYNRNVALVNPAKMKRLLARLREDELDMTDETDKLFYQFVMNGGETGYANIRDIEQRKNDIKRELKKNSGQLPLRLAWDLLGERLDEYNRAVELCARFAAFKTSRELGRTIDRSVYDAKEISVNFNKKGSGAKFLNTEGQTAAGNAAAVVSGLGRSFYVFWNAGIQGTTNFGRQIGRHPKKAMAGMASMFLLGALMAATGGGDDGDDEYGQTLPGAAGHGTGQEGMKPIKEDDGSGGRNAYYNLPEYVRRSNIVFRLPWMNKSWVALPLPVEYRAMYGMGELAASALSGKEHYTAGELAHETASQISQMMPLDFMEGGGGFKAFIPSAVKPFAEVMTNESWTGMPIYKDTPFNKNAPEWTKAYKSANPYLVGASKWLNEKTGGDYYKKGKVDINPAKVEYLMNGLFGGMSRSVDEMVKMGETAIGRMEYDPKNMMFLNRLVKRGDERTEYRAVNNEYWRIREECETLRELLNHYERDTADGVFDYAEKIAWLNNSPEYRVLMTYEPYAAEIRDMEEMLREAERQGDRLTAAKVETDLNQCKACLVRDVEAVRKGKLVQK